MDFGQGELDREGDEPGDGVHALVGCEDPSAVFLSEEGVDDGSRGADEDVLAEGGAVAVDPELAAAVAGLGGGGDDFDEDGGVEDVGLAFVGGVELRGSPDDGEVGVDVTAAGTGGDSGVGFARVLALVVRQGLPLRRVYTVTGVLVMITLWRYVPPAIMRTSPSWYWWRWTAVASGWKQA